mgnify:CR=1 FL=1
MTKIEKYDILGKVLSQNEYNKIRSKKMKIKLNIKNVLTLGITAIMITTFSLFFINTSLAANTAKVTVDTANLRETTQTDSKILDLINKGESVEVLETKGEWYKVKYKNITGYLRKDLVQLNNETTKTDNENTTKTNNVTENVQTSKNEENSVNEGSSTAVEVANKLEDIEVDTVEKYKTKEDVKLKVIPLINALELEEVKKDTEVEVKDTINNWICVTVQGKQGWVIADKLEKLEKVETKTQESTSKNQETSTEQNVEQENSNQNVQQQEQSNVQETQQVQNTQTETVKQTSKTMYINTETVNLRSSADRTSTIVVQLAINTKVEVVSEENGWSKISVNGKEGYVLSSLLSSKKQETSRGATESRIAAANKTETTKSETTKTQSAQTTNTSTSNQTTTSSTNGANVVAYAKQFIGTKYTYGGTSPSTGFDCSGFTSYVYKHFGVSLPRTSGGQSGVGTAVTKANLQAGDLVIYSGHVAIYVGGGNVIHSPRPGKTVCIVPLSQAARGFSGGRRVIK